MLEKIIVSKFELLFRRGSTVILWLVLVVLPTSLFAQLNNSTDFLVLQSGDSLFGTVAYVNLEGFDTQFYKKIRLTEANGNKKRFKRKAVLAFQSSGALYESFLLAPSSEKLTLVTTHYSINPKKGTQYFLKVMAKGAVSHYQMEWIEQGSATPMHMDLLKKENDRFFVRATQGLLGLKRSLLKNYFNDCAELQEQIAAKQIKHVGQVVDFYNNQCGN